MSKADFIYGAATGILGTVAGGIVASTGAGILAGIAVGALPVVAVYAYYKGFEDGQNDERTKHTTAVLANDRDIINTIDKILSNEALQEKRNHNTR